MYVFVVTASWISEHTVMTEIRGVYAHMHQTLALTRLLKDEGCQVLVTKHAVQDGKPDFSVAVGGTPGIRDLGRARLGTPVPAFPRPVGEGVQTDPTVVATRAPSGSLLP